MIFEKRKHISQGIVLRFIPRETAATVTVAYNCRKRLL